MIPLIKPFVPPLTVAMDYFRKAVAKGMLSNFGELHDSLSGRLSAYTGGYALPISTGTAAVEVALRSLNLAPGSKVLVPDFTHSGTLLAVVRAGLVPVLAGVDPMSWTLRVEEAQYAFLGNKIKAAVVVSPFGYDEHVKDWEAMSQMDGLPLVYDLAGAFGTFTPTQNPRCFSFHATKNMGVGEGGAVVFSDGDTFTRAMRLINFDTQSDRTIASLDGCNAKMDELKAAFLLASLDCMKQTLARIQRKRDLIRFYRSNIPGSYAPGGKHNPSLCVLSNLPAMKLEASAAKEQIAFKRYYPLLSRMPALAGVERLSESDEIMETCCALPSDVDLHDAYRVTEVVGRYL